MILFLTHPRNRTAWQATALAFVLLAAITLSAIYPLNQAHAQDCYDCQGGGDPTEPPNDPPDLDPTDPPCDPYFDPPTISANLTLVPAYPITLGQDPDDRGVDVRGITARGGMHHCPNGGSARIVAFRWSGCSSPSPASSGSTARWRANIPARASRAATPSRQTTPPAASAPAKRSFPFTWPRSIPATTK